MNTIIVPQELTHEMLEGYAHGEAVVTGIASHSHVKAFMADEPAKARARDMWYHTIMAAPHLDGQVDTRRLGHMEGNRNWNRFKLEWAAMVERTAAPRKEWLRKPWSLHLLQDVITEAGKAGIYTAMHGFSGLILINIGLTTALIWVLI
jgi:hypothetical protein